jgi:uncharacterized protein
MTIGDILITLVLGFVFGWTLDKAGLTKYHKIVNVYRFTDLAVLKYMMSAIIVGMAGVWTLKGLGLVELTGTISTYVPGVLLGGALFGVGMAAAGFCPGTVAAGAGRGNLDYLIPGFAGFLVGAAAFGLTYQSFMPQLTQVMNLGNLTLPELLNLSPGLTVVVVIVLFSLVLYIIERTHAARHDKVSITPVSGPPPAPRSTRRPDLSRQGTD